jgi:ethanolamine utilization protein EutQ (cupin superfamily)
MDAKDYVSWQTSDMSIDEVEQHVVEMPDLHEKRQCSVMQTAYMRLASSTEYEWTLQDKHSDRSPQSNPG